jgi:uncharacterized lipoprotein YmbA
MKKWLIALLLPLLVGCLSRPQPDIASFLLQAPALRIAPLASNYTVKVLPVKVVAPFANTFFIYRLDEERYTADFYHRFLSPPGQMLTDAMTAGLSQGRLFKTVLSASTVQEGDLLLEATVTALYADYRAHPTAVLTLHAYLSRSDQNGGNYLLNQTIDVRIPMQAKNAAAYAQAMNSALAQGLQQLQEKMGEALAVK